MDLTRFEGVQLLPKAAAFRGVLDAATQGRGWEVAAAVTTIFLEGTPYERGELDPNAPKRPAPSLAEHPLVKHYGLPVEHLALTRAHRSVEGSHRAAAWHLMHDHVTSGARLKVLSFMEETLTAWLAYRDEVAQACALRRDDTGAPTRLAS
jgi:pyrroloquinoline-quinone synthase